MQKNQNNRVKWLHIRLTSDEYHKMEKRYNQSTKQTLSAYARAVLLEKPITVNTRNQSVDELVAALILIRGELLSIGKNFNQLVKRAHTTSGAIEWSNIVKECDNLHQQFVDKMIQVERKMAEINDKWLQE